MIKALATKNVVAVLLTISMVLGFTFAFATPAKADMLSDLQAQVQALLAQISSLQGSSTTSGNSMVMSHTFTRNHKMGDTGGEVMWIQQFLNSHGAMVSSTGAGSPGNETYYFGGKTKAAVAMWQRDNDVSPASGYWGPLTRAAANAMGNDTNTPLPLPLPEDTGTATTTTSGAVTVGMATQPANSLAPESASRVPFTTLTLTNNSSASVTINNITVQRTGLGADAVFSGIVLVDEMGLQLGSAKTLNSNHQASVGDPFVINPGQTKTITVAGNMAADLDSYAGQVISLQVTGINTSATVSGSLPITGASQTINSTLAIGSLSMSVGSSDLDSAQTSETIGTNGRVGAGVRAQAGSAEDVWIKSIRWNQSGSAAAGDLANVVTVLDTISYPTTVSSDGKYYTTIFPGNGIKVLKGLTKEVIVKFDIVGGPARTVNFDIYKATDLYVVGDTFGYGMTPSQSESGTVGTGSEFTSGSPFFSGSTFTISAGTVTSLARANEVTAQNVVEATPNQILGGFAMDVKGEPISVQQQIYHFGITGGNGTAVDITNITLVDENDAVVAGPVNGVDAASKATFTDTVTFPTGRHVYTLKGQIGTDFANNDTVQASTTISSDWSNATGQITGNTVTLTGLTAIVTGNIVTVKGGSVALTINSAPAAQTIVAGVSGLTISTIKFDATESGENVRFNSAKFLYNDTSLAAAEDPINCFAYNGATRLNSTAINPGTDDTEYTFTFDTALVVPKGTGTNVDIKCNIPSGADGSFNFGLESASASTNATFTGTGVASTQTITPTTPNTSGTDTPGNSMTITSSGALTVAKDSLSPSYTVASGGTSGVTLGILRFSGTNEDMRLDRVALEMTGVAATSTPNDITRVTLWDGLTQVGEAFFSGTNRNATSSIIGTVIIPSNSFKTLTVKGDLADIGNGLSGDSGVLLKIDYDGTNSTGTRAIGQSSGSTINHSSTSDTAVSGVRMFRSYPTIAQLATPSLVISNGTLQELTRFSVGASASAGQADLGIQLSEITVNIATSSASALTGTTTIENIDVYAYIDAAFSQGVPGEDFNNGLVYDGTDAVGNSGDNELEFTSVINVPNGSTYYFKVVADVTLTNGTGADNFQVTTKLLGDAAFPVAIAGLMGGEAAIDTETDDDFVWSPNSTTTESTSALARLKLDWTNGYGLSGLPSGGLSGTTLN